MKNKKILCCFPLETRPRDLDPRLHLGLQCVKEGYSCLIGSKSGVIKEMFSQKIQFIYFEKGLNAVDQDFYRLIKASKGAIVSLDEEGGVYNEKLYKQELLRRNKENILQFVDLIFTWGEKQKKILFENTTFPENKIISSGHPRFDLCKPKFRDFQTALLKNRIDPKIKYILINSTFTAANTILTLDEEIKLRMRARKDETLDVEYERLLYSYRKLLIKYFYELVVDINNKYPEYTIIFRPHPGENVKYYEKLFQKMKNIIVTGDGSVQEWISNSQIVLHHDCTTAIEALLSEKFIISYCKIRDNDFVQELPIKISHIANEPNQILEIINNLETSSYDEKQLEIAFNKIRPIISNVDFESSEVIIKSLKNIFINEKSDSKVIREIFFKNIIRKVNLTVKNFIINYSFRSKVKIRNKLKFPDLNKKDIIERVSLLKKIDKDLPEIKIEQTGKNTYLLSS